jgi:hypothetical protein
VTGTVTYTADVTYQASSTNTEQEPYAALPFQTSVTVPSGGFYDLIAQDNADNGGTTITCTVLDDGSVISTYTERGPYAVAQCSGSVP